MVTWDGSLQFAGIHLYLDKSDVSGAGTDALSTESRASDANNEATIDASSSPNYAGRIDDVRIYNRVLTPVEVGEL